MAKAPVKRTFDARPDTVDFRDRMFEATLVEVPPRISLADYQQWKVPILDQGHEGACTGFGLATVANYLLRGRKVDPDPAAVSPRMFYEMARRYDEWPGEDYEGSSARGAMKGWHKHGVCASDVWPYVASDRSILTDARAEEAAKRPLGAYYRVNHKDLVCLHAALAEVGILYATGIVHEGWQRLDAEGRIPYAPGQQVLGGHAFAIVAYDHEGLWVQNSWGPQWGYEGFAKISYDDWLDNATDAWVARLGVPLLLKTAGGVARLRAAVATSSDGYAFHELRPHVVSVGNEGQLLESGTYATTTAQLKEILTEDFPRITADWKKRRLLLWFHGGLVSADAAVQRVAELRATLLKEEVYPVAFIWNSDLWSTVRNILREALNRRRPESLLLDRAKDFMLDRLDDTLEPLAAALGGKALWNEMKENAAAATISKTGACRLALQHIASMAANLKNVEIHLVGYSAGSVMMGPVIQLLTSSGRISGGPLSRNAGLDAKVQSCTLWAPACTIDLFRQTYLPAIESKQINRFALFTLTDEAEQDDECANIYHKSLLYLVSNAFESPPAGQTNRGRQILGMEKWIDRDDALPKLFKRKTCRWVRAPNTFADGSPSASRAQHHGDFDDDATTLRATLAHILHEEEQDSLFMRNRSAEFLESRRTDLNRAAFNIGVPGRL